MSCYWKKSTFWTITIALFVIIFARIITQIPVYRYIRDKNHEGADTMTFLNTSVISVLIFIIKIMSIYNWYISLTQYLRKFMLIFLLLIIAIVQWFAFYLAMDLIQDEILLGRQNESTQRQSKANVFFTIMTIPDLIIIFFLNAIELSSKPTPPKSSDYFDEQEECENRKKFIIHQTNLTNPGDFNNPTTSGFSSNNITTQNPGGSVLSGANIQKPSITSQRGIKN